MEDLDAETGVEPVNDGFADRSLNRLGTPRLTYDDDTTSNRGNGHHIVSVSYETAPVFAVNPHRAPNVVLHESSLEPLGDSKEKHPQMHGVLPYGSHTTCASDWT